jgi:hypothetical protein
LLAHAVANKPCTLLRFVANWQAKVDEVTGVENDLENSKQAKDEAIKAEARADRAEVEVARLKALLNAVDFVKASEGTQSVLLFFLLTE